jgi:hypothetical protein
MSTEPNKIIYSMVSKENCGLRIADCGFRNSDFVALYSPFSCVSLDYFAAGLL